jgi:predicted nuclease with RNAse H fold
MINNDVYIGIDIQIRRDCCYAVIDESGILIESRWFSNDEVDAVDLLKRWSKSGQIYLGIDAPRTLQNGRNFSLYQEKKKGLKWILKMTN